jgi:DHA1 family tetracycline resistance protein-like MFS transporter
MNKENRAPLLLMALTILIDFTGFGLIIPLLPFWAEHLGANAVGVGLIITIYALAQFIFTPVLGALSDRYGRKPVILWSLVIEVVSLLLTALAGSLPILLAVRFLGGLGASNIGSAQAVVSDVTTKQDRARGMGLIGASIGLGFVIGPALGGVLSPLGATVPFWVAAAAACLNALLVLFFLPETRNLRKGEQTGRRGNLLRGWHTAARYPLILRLVTTNLLFTIAFTIMETVLPLFTQKKFGWMASQNGYLFTYVGIIVVVMQGGVIGQLVKHWKERAVLLMGLTILAIGLFSLAFSSQIALLFISLGFVSVGEGAVTPIISTILSFASPAEAQGEILGVSQGVGGLGRIVGPLLAGSIFAFAGTGTPFILSGILSLSALLLALSTTTISSEATQHRTEQESGAATRSPSGAR